HDHRESAAYAANKRHRQIDDAFRDAAGFHQGAGEDEERNGEQDERIDAAKNLDRQDDEIDAANADKVGERRERERERQRQAERGGDEEADEQNQQRWRPGEERDE